MSRVGALEASRKFNALAAARNWPSLCDPTLSFVQPAFCGLVRIWQEAALEGRLPYRREIDLRRLKAMLPALAIYERVMNRTVRYRVRVMGTEFAEAMGDLSGRFLDEAVPAEYLARWEAALDTGFQAGGPLRLVGQLDVSEKPYLCGEYFEAPLLTDEGAPDLILAAGHFMPGEWWEVAAMQTSRSH